MIEVSKYKRKPDMAEGTRRFDSLQGALDYLEKHPEEEPRILVYPGIYHEQVTVRIPGVIIAGESREEEGDAAGNAAEGQSAGSVVITYGLAGREILADGMKRGTFRTYTCFVDADDVTLQNLTIENSAGPGTKAGQAIALYADGDRLVVDSCRLLGWQDTLFTAPLPLKEIEKNGFIGPKQFAPRRNNRQYYKDCYIEGEVDFIFGGAVAYFENCTLFSKDVDREVKGFVTAPSTPEGLPYGYVMESCRFTGNCPDRTVFLGRPWREWGKTVLLRCQIGPHIKDEGWDDWGKELAHTTSFFAEYGCKGPGAGLDARPNWCHVLSEEDAKVYTREHVLKGEDGWSPSI
ncbi:MAG: pectinesterase family protein [Lachnospiraceae bacterium]|nr:pectinesterase family protein [Lachnospiraceae bacterium]